MKTTVNQYIGKCAVAFPDFGDIDDALIKAKARVFTELFEEMGMTREQVIQGFKSHLANGKRFPVPSDIADGAKMLTIYKFNEGPYGHGAFYRLEDPYTQKVLASGEPIDQYAHTMTEHQARIELCEIADATDTPTVPALPKPASKVIPARPRNEEAYRQAQMAAEALNKANTARSDVSPLGRAQPARTNAPETLKTARTGNGR